MSLFVPPFQPCHMTQQRTLLKHIGLPLWHKPSLWQYDIIFCPKTITKRFLPTISACDIVLTLSHDTASNSPQIQRVAMVAQAIAIATMTLILVQKRWPSNFDPLFPFVSPFQHCHMTQHRTFHKRSCLSWWHKPSLWQQSRHKLFENTFQANLTSFLLCCRFNSVTGLSIELFTNPVGCYGGTSRRFANNDVRLCPKTMAKLF